SSNGALTLWISLLVIRSAGTVAVATVETPETLWREAASPAENFKLVAISREMAVRSAPVSTRKRYGPCPANSTGTVMRCVASDLNLTSSVWVVLSIPGGPDTASTGRVCGWAARAALTPRAPQASKSRTGEVMDDISSNTALSLPSRAGQCRPNIESMPG